jgi:hypothetical protein
MEKTKPVVAYLKQAGIISDKNMQKLPGGGTGYKALPVNLEDVSKLRAIVNRSWRSAVNSGDDAAAVPLNELRGHLDDAMNEAGGRLFKAYNQIRGAKGAAYENNPLIDQLISDRKGYRGTPMIEDSEVFNKAVLNSSPEQFGKVWPRLTPEAQRLTKAQVAKHIEDRVYSNMATNEQGDVVASAAKLNQTLNQIGPEKLRTIYGPDQSRMLRRLNTAVREISTPPRGTVPQGSAPKLQFLYRNTVKLLGLAGKVPGLNVVADVAERRAASQAAQAASERATNILDIPQYIPPEQSSQIGSILSPMLLPKSQQQ